MGIKHEVFEITSDILLKGMGLTRANKWACKLNEKMVPIFTARKDGEEYKLYCPNELTRYRAVTYFTKEPETIDWIDTFKPGETYFDIGANVGLYAIYAAKKGARVYAFEPESQNYALINRNTYLNGLADKMTCLNIAFSDRSGLDYLFLPQFMPGGALNNLGEATDYKHEAFAPKFKQAVMAYTVDSFLEQHPQAFPTHVKIDVDGIEAKIIEGAKKTLSDPRVKSLLIELNEALPGDLALKQKIESFGLKFLYKKPSAVGHTGSFSTLINYVFMRSN